MPSGAGEQWQRARTIIPLYLPLPKSLIRWQQGHKEHPIRILKPASSKATSREQQKGTVGPWENGPLLSFAKRKPYCERTRVAS